LRRFSARAKPKQSESLCYKTFDKIAYPSLTSITKLSIKGQGKTMNQAHWLTERLNEDKATQLMKQAENERLAKEANQELPPRPFLAKLRADLIDLSSKSQYDKPKAR
jgi:hypothetical protein